MVEQLATNLLSEEDKMRAGLYDLLARILFVSPDSKLLAELQSLSGDETELGAAFSTLAKLAATTDLDAAREEYDQLFIGLGRGELLPYGSYYLTGFLNEKPLAKLRNSMQNLGIARREDVVEPEDHIGSLCEMMAGLIIGRYGAPVDLETQREFFANHMEPWSPHFFKDLEQAKFSRLYQPVGTIGRVFVEIESNAFEMD